MFCIKCGRQNPDEANFCAFCGAKLEKPTQENVIPIEEMPADGKKPEKIPIDIPLQGDRHSALSADIPRRDVPAQKRRPASDPSAAYRKVPVDIPLQDAPRKKPRAVPDPFEEEERPRRTVRPFDENPAQPDARKSKKPQPGEAVDSSGRARKEPTRPSTVAPIPKRFHKHDTLIPRRRHPKEDDLFFEDVPPPDAADLDGELEEEDYESDLKHRVLSFTAGLALLGLFCLVFWMLAIPSGRVFCARWGLPAPASAYRQLGDEYLASNQYKSAASAYYSALGKDPEGADYELALRVAQTHELIGETDIAEKAYIMCITLDPSKPEPYQALAKIYRQKGQDDQAAAILQTGAKNTGDESLLND